METLDAPEKRAAEVQSDLVPDKNPKSPQYSEDWDSFSQRLTWGEWFFEESSLDDLENGTIVQQGLLEPKMSKDSNLSFTDGKVPHQKSIHKRKAPEERNRSRRNYDELLNHVLETEPSLELLCNHIRSVSAPRWGEWQQLIAPAQQGCRASRDRLIDMYLKTVVALAWDYHNSHYTPLIEAICDGIHGLMKAIDKFNLQKGTSFVHYYILWVRQCIQRHGEFGINRPATPYFPAHARDALRPIVRQARNHSCSSCDITLPCLNLLSELKEITAFEADTLCLRLRQLGDAESIQDLDETTERETRRFLLKEELGESIESWHCRIDVDGSEFSFEDEIERVARAEALELALSRLSERERLVLTLRYGFNDCTDRTLDQVGTVLGVTRERVRQIEAKAFRKLRASRELRSLRKAALSGVIKPNKKELSSQSNCAKIDKILGEESQQNQFDECHEARDILKKENNAAQRQEETLDKSSRRSYVEQRWSPLLKTWIPKRTSIKQQKEKR